MPYFKIKTRNGQTLKILLDTGSNKNYIKSALAENPKKSKDYFCAKTIYGNVQITHHTLLNLFGDSAQPIKFYLLPGLRTFDAILGNDTLRELSAIIHTAQLRKNPSTLETIPIQWL